MGQIQIAQAVPISIHALREEGDAREAGNHHERIQFLSTPSARRATHTGNRKNLRKEISIHALREEGDKATTLQAQSHD